MAKLVQGNRYEDKDQEVNETEVGIEEKSSKLKLPLPVLVGAFVCIVIIVIIIIASIPKTTNQLDSSSAEPANSTGDVEVGDSDYWNQFDTAFAYSAKEREQLRAWGYTGDEIEENEDNEVPVNQLIAESKKVQEEARATLSNPESPEYKALLENTWLGQQSITLPTYEQGVTEKQITYVTRTLNADYDKVPAHGHNLFLKVYLQDNSYVFMECPIVRYMQLANSGNIVVTYTEINVNGIMLVSDMEEVAVQ